MTTYKKIATNASDRHAITNIIRSYVFGNEPVREYSPDKIYNKGDKIYIIDDNGNIVILTAKENGITGQYDSTKWTQGTVGTGSGGEIVISTTEPTEEGVQMWIKPLRSSILDIPNTDPEIDPDEGVSESYVMMFDSEGIPIVDEVEDTTSLNAGDIILDIESETETSFDVESKLVEPGKILIDSQDDISVGEDIINEPDARVWLDTDLSDDDDIYNK